MKLYRIRNWERYYENNRTRELKALSWVPLPNSHDGDGYTILVSRPEGAALLGAWVACVQVASKCDPRGTLLRRSGMPHNETSLSRITRLDEKWFVLLFKIASFECNWLICEEFETISHQDAVAPQASEIALTGMEGKGMEGKEVQEGVRENGVMTKARVVIHFLNEKTGRHYREVATNLALIAARLKEPEVTLEGVEKMITRQCQLWKGRTQEEYLRPETLFGKEKFDGYYAARDAPIFYGPQNQQTSFGNYPANPRNAYTHATTTDYAAAAKRATARLEQKMAENQNPESAGTPPA